jgi:hypothetical protein
MIIGEKAGGASLLQTSPPTIERSSDAIIDKTILYPIIW